MKKQRSDSICHNIPNSNVTFKLSLYLASILCHDLGQQMITVDLREANRNI